MKIIPNIELNTERNSQITTTSNPKIQNQRDFTKSISQKYIANFKPVLGQNLHFKSPKKLFSKKLHLKEPPKTAYFNTRSSIAQNFAKTDHTSKRPESVQSTSLTSYYPPQTQRKACSKHSRRTSNAMDNKLPISKRQKIINELKEIAHKIMIRNKKISAKRLKIKKMQNTQRP